jgi:sugar phosphate isomerase/epimerase
MPLRRRPVLACCVQFENQLKGSFSVVDVPDIAQRAGADGVEFREVYWKDKAAELPAARDRMRALGLTPTYATFTTLLNDDAAARERLLVDLDDAHQLGAGILRVFRGGWPAGDDPEPWRWARRTIERAEGYGIQLALENFVRVPGNHRVEVEAALLALGTPTVGTNLDTSNYVLNGEDLLANARALSSWICYSHLKDVRAEGDTKTIVPLGAGSLPFGELFEIYDATGRDFPVTFEFPGGDHPERAIAQSLEHLRSLGMPR